MDHARSRHTPVHLPPGGRRQAPTIVFVTVCCSDRRPLLAQADAAGVIRSAWRAADHWLVGRYVIMPDHVHLFCAPSSDDSLTLRKWVSFWKSWASRHWPRPAENPVWERDFWDRELRTEENYEAKWEYVRNNPVRQGHVACPDDWLHAGEINVLEW